MSNKSKIIAAISGLVPDEYRTRAEIARATGLSEKEVQSALAHISKEQSARFQRCLNFAGHRINGYRMADKPAPAAPKAPQAADPRMPAKRTPPQFTPYTFTQAPIRADAEAHKACPSLRDGKPVPYCPPKPMLVGRTGTIAWMPGRLG